MSVTLHLGCCMDVLPTLPAESVQCVVCSPPYYGLRDYQTATWEGGDPACDHGAAKVARRQAERQPTLGGGVPGSLRDKPVTECGCGARRIDAQIGLEPSPQEYVDRLVAVFREVRRVLHPTGVVFLNLGDSYAGSKVGSTNGTGASGLRRDGRPEESRAASNARQGVNMAAMSFRKDVPAGLKAKDLMMIPARVAIALQDDGWWLRSEIIWSKAAPMPESVRDRPTCAHEKVFLLTKAERYFYDADAVREPFADDRMGNPGEYKRTSAKSKGANNDRQDGGFLNNGSGWTRGDELGGRNLRNVWHLNPEPSGIAHFAMMPTKLAATCIKAGTSARGQCPCCGSPWVRQVERPAAKTTFPSAGKSSGYVEQGLMSASARRSSFHGPGWRTAEPDISVTTGWSPSCFCPEHDPVPQTVLDPFAGAATTLLVADRLQRHGIGIELNPENIARAKMRLSGDAPLFAEVA